MTILSVSPQGPNVTSGRVDRHSKLSENNPIIVDTKPLSEPCLRYLRTRLLDNTLHLKEDNKFTMIRGFGKGYNESNLLNFSHV